RPARRRARRDSGDARAQSGSVQHVRGSASGFGIPAGRAWSYGVPSLGRRRHAAARRPSPRASRRVDRARKMVRNARPFPRRLRLSDGPIRGSGAAPRCRARRASMKLARRYVEKPWGRTGLPPRFGAPDGRRIGELWFTGGGELPLLAKYIFTSERLSIQVHPPEKTECWYVLDAEPGATIGLGLLREISSDELRSAALDGSIERLVAWRPVRAGDFFFVPPGTIHAIGGGLTLLEFQQNADVTWRLYDYGRPRALHVEEAVAVARPA